MRVKTTYAALITWAIVMVLLSMAACAASRHTSSAGTVTTETRDSIGRAVSQTLAISVDSGLSDTREYIEIVHKVSKDSIGSFSQTKVIRLKKSDKKIVSGHYIAHENVDSAKLTAHASEAAAAASVAPTAREGVGTVPRKLANAMGRVGVAILLLLALALALLILLKR